MFGITLRDLGASLVGHAVQNLLAKSMGCVNAVTAATGSDQATGVPITAAFTRVTTVGTAGDSLTLPPATPGAAHVVINAAAANSMDVFPSSGGVINALSADAALAVAANKTVIFFCVVAGTWNTVVTA